MRRRESKRKGMHRWHPIDSTGGPQIRYHGGPSRWIFVAIGACGLERCARSGHKKKWPWNMMHDTRHGIVFGTEDHRILSRRDVAEGSDRRAGGGGKGYMCESRMVSLMILEHFDRLKKDFHYWPTTTARALSQSLALNPPPDPPKLPFKRSWPSLNVAIFYCNLMKNKQPSESRSN